MKKKFIEIANLTTELTSITTRVYQNDRRIAIFRSDPELDESIDSFGPYFDKLKDFNTPTGCITTPSKYRFGFIAYPDYTLVLGPVKESDTSQQSLERIAARIDPTLANKDRIIENLRNCPRISLYTLLPIIAQIYRALNFSRNTIEARIYQGMEAAISTVTFFDDLLNEYSSVEQTTGKVLAGLIEQGNVDAIRKWFRNPAFFLMDINVTQDSMRNFKDHFIIMSTFFATAAVRGGLDAMLALKLQLDAISAVEAADNMSLICSIQEQLALNYTKRVSLLRETPVQSRLLERATQYIQRNIYNTIRTEDVAKALNISRGYLSKAFHDETGCTIHDYILNLKINEAKLLLNNPANSIAEVSELLSFSSQSYFTKIFRAYAGVTPSQYRKLEM